MANKVDLSKFNNNWFSKGRGRIIVGLWIIVNSIFFNSHFLPISSLKRVILKWFGAKIGKGVIIKPKVCIKYPWKLEIGANTWIGENVWIDNLDVVKIGSNCCLSQGALLLSGNHNYKKKSFDLLVRPITLEDGAWVGARAIVVQGVTMKSHSILAVNSVATANLEPYGIYQGNPAVKIRERIISES
ncbi:MAG: colanic acid biosynthesis acetyltransferase WcaF [Crocinitomicaceae bacterium]|nr:colanic acid biosynthesis acetyltransferase WcaF [Crocinitomicaceae bacterium]